MVWHFSRLALGLLLKAWLPVKLFGQNRVQSQSSFTTSTKQGPPETQDLRLSTSHQLDRGAVLATSDSHRPAATGATQPPARVVGDGYGGPRCHRTGVRVGKLLGKAPSVLR